MPAQIERELLWASGPDIWIDFFLLMRCFQKHFGKIFTSQYIRDSSTTSSHRQHLRIFSQKCSKRI